MMTTPVLARRLLRVVAVGACALTLGLTCGFSSAETPAAHGRQLSVVLDDNYPPYIFRDAGGNLRGYLVDSWRLWEKKTGTPVSLLASDWSLAQQRMLNGQADVIDTMFVTEDRLRWLSFSRPYAEVPVSIYSHRSVTGITGVETLRGFQVGVKEGDACISALKRDGIETIRAYSSYETLVQAAIRNEVRVFCLDEPPANHILFRERSERDFRQAFRLYSGEFHRAYHKEDVETLARVESGFAAISKEEDRALRDKWMGNALDVPRYGRVLIYVVVALLGVGMFLLAWIASLRRMVRQRTEDLAATMNAIPDLMFEHDIEGRYLRCHALESETGLLAAPPDRLLGKTVREVLPGPAAETCLAALREADVNGFSSGYQIELDVPQGKRWFELSVARKGARTGANARFVTLSRDITAHHQSEECLRQQSDRLQILSQAAQDINARLDADIIARSLVEAALRVTGATAGCVGLMGDDGPLRFAELNRSGAVTRTGYRFSVGEGIPGNVIETGTACLNNDVRGSGLLPGDFPISPMPSSVVAIPVPDRRGRLRFCICLFDKPGGFDEADVQLLRGLGASAAIAFDNTEILAAQRRVEQALRESELLKSTVLDSARQAIIATDRNGLIMVFNAGAEIMLGYSASEVVGMTTPAVFHDPVECSDYAERVSRDFGLPVAPGFAVFATRTRLSGEPDENEWTWIRKDGERLAVHLSVTAMFDSAGSISGYLGIATDVSARKRSEEVIARLAHFDQLTGLPNRVQLRSRFDYILGHARRSQEPFALLYLDLDRFKNINDSLGHETGDELLIRLAKRLRSLLRDEDTLSRQGGDEFILVLPGANADAAARLASRILQECSVAYPIEPYDLTCTASIGIALYPADGDSFETLSMNADAAMYRAKDAGRNTYLFYAAEMQGQTSRVLKLENALRRVLDSGELQLHYQPQYSLVERRIIGAEALLRWNNPELGAVSPAEFIPIAEDSGLIVPIGEWVLRSAVRQMRAWLDVGLPMDVISVNLSAIQFRQPDLIRRIGNVLSEEGLSSRRLELELTESVATHNADEAVAIMDRLHELGVRMSIDDFGVGYSSMNYLKRFQASRIKIDRSFISNLSVDPEDRAIISAIINLARSLGMTTLAEGVETAEQLAFLRAQGCDEVQGYYFARPLDVGAFEAFVRCSPTMPE